MLRAGWWWLCLGFCGHLVGQTEAPSPGESSGRSRPYAVLRGQNLDVENEAQQWKMTIRKELNSLLMGTVFCILLVTMILMAFCVYKPIQRR